MKGRDRQDVQGQDRGDEAAHARCGKAPADRCRRARIFERETLVSHLMSEGYVGRP
jgi:hypothetical protein